MATAFDLNSTTVSASASGSAFDDTASQTGSSTVQGAIDANDARIDTIKDSITDAFGVTQLTTI